jgi:hypothetical protein
MVTIKLKGLKTRAKAHICTNGSKDEISGNYRNKNLKREQKN